MSDMGDFWRDVKPDIIDNSKQKRRRNRENSAKILDQHSVKYVSKNDGSHLVVKAEKCTIDFWPGTGLWLTRGFKKEGRGVFGLLKYIGARG